jgi:chemotaxis protein CheZ
MSYDVGRKLFSAERHLMQQRGINPQIHHVGGGPSNKEVLKALAEIKKLIEEVKENAAPAPDEVPAEAPEPAAVVEDLPEMSVLRAQLKDLKESIDKTKMEIAALHNTGEGEDDRFVTAAMELDAIVNATEVATNNILGSAEDIDDLAREIKERSSDVKIQDHADSIANAVINIFENCNFQDITGQRTGKVVKTINYLEERILTMINIWGEEEFEGLAAPEDNRTDDEKLLAGPQLEGKGISQNDIDSLFD